MKTHLLIAIIVLALFSSKTNAQSATINSHLETKKSENMKQIFIDKFIVPEKSKQEFLERVNINRNFIKNLNGFIKDEAYERTDEHGNFIFMTIAVWENEAVLKKAKEAVQSSYKKEGFDIAEMFARLKITMDRNIYKESAKP
ncbi:antibiotic biosynthesis monooxygenase [Flavobacterium sp. JAS]|uniref:antibiotic biosynthesis monooxygenase n=1 Tax=Flavobacterium sp. JAS TaxID=2897329 RepID=UPI001E3B99BF|nr:antibiotic biosynthesis monooxygenase [Flavobacterium sp. JAS]MCD0472704.1 antibiotic biosynthesis monooxygenase [Flavobacterium sp. JAS]